MYVESLSMAGFRKPDKSSSSTSDKGGELFSLRLSDVRLETLEKMKDLDQQSIRAYPEEDEAAIEKVAILLHADRKAEAPLRPRDTHLRRFGETLTSRPDRRESPWQSRRRWPNPKKWTSA